MSDEARQRYQEAKEKRDQIREAWYKRNEEHIKVLADMKRYVFTTFLAVAVGIARSDDEFSIYVGIVACSILLLTFFVLVIVRYRKINRYDNGKS